MYEEGEMAGLRPGHLPLFVHMGYYLSVTMHPALFVAHTQASSSLARR
jgi:hypothetical protein